MASHFKTYHIDSGVTGPNVLITAGVHGDEYEPMLAARKLVDELAPLLNRGSVTIVPVVNLAAYRRAARCGNDEKDLARTCPGDRNGSITARVASEVSELIKNTGYYIDMHTGGGIFNIFPLAGYMLHSSAEVLEVQRNMAHAFGLPVVWGTESRAEGRTLSVARDAHVPAIYVEFGGPPPVNPDIIHHYLRGCLNVLASLAMLTKPERKEPGTVYWIEDHRANMGHLQSKTPAPTEGIFMPGVQVGAQAKAGANWGKIIDPVSGAQTEVTVDSDGLVLFMRTSGYVKKDESLGGLIPITEPGKIILNEL